MAMLEGLEWTFDTVAKQYEKMRPGYVKEMYEDIFKYRKLDTTSHAVEVGIGGGQATLPVLKTGCRVTAVEYGKNFSECKGRKVLSQAIDKVYAAYMSNAKKGSEYGEQEAKERAEIAQKYGFVDICYKLYRRTRTFSAKEYTALLGTYSDHMVIEEEKRKAFFLEIEDVINQFGGQITIYDTIPLYLVQNPL